MIRKIAQLICSAGCFVLPASAQNLTPEQYIALYKDIAIREMKRMGVPAAISLAQGTLAIGTPNGTLKGT